MPDTLHPPYGLGAQQPRTLIRWLDVNSQNGPLKRARYTFQIPPFDIPIWGQAVVPPGYSLIVGVFDYTAPNNFAITDYSQLVSNATYSLYISWTDSNNVVHRYKLMESPNSLVFQDFPVYNGQLIKKNFRIEVWNVALRNAKSTNTQTLTIWTSVLKDQDYRYTQDSNFVATPTLNTNVLSPNLNLPIVLPNSPTLN